MASGDGIDTIEMEPVIMPSSSAGVKGKLRTSESEDGQTSLNGAESELNNEDDERQQKYIDKERKIGHRRVGEGGEITYKKIQTSQIMGSIQLGIQHTVGSLASKPKRDLLMMDFWEIESISFPPDGSSLTPAHHYSEFRFKIYAPIAFRYFRDLFGIEPDDFMMSMCSAPLRELSNPGASGSIFYLTDDDEFIIKTVQHKEGEFLQKLLPGYYMNLNQNPRTLLPKFFGLYCFQCNAKNVRLVAMNNLLPSDVKMHLKYDLKGSTFKRKASKGERNKKSPTYKDLDFMEHHPNGIFLEAETYSALMKTIQRDCTVLESFKIMDYSMLLGIHNLDIALKEKQEERMSSGRGPNSRLDEYDYEDAPEADQCIAQDEREMRSAGATSLNRSRSINRQRLPTAMESIQASQFEPIDEEENVPSGGIPARSEKGERLLLYIGIIDILQSYRLKKKLEHTFKSIFHDGDTVSVCRPSFYANRFQNFMGKTVFKKVPSTLKHYPSKRKNLLRLAQKPSMAESDVERQLLASGRNGPSCSSTPPPAFDDIADGQPSKPNFEKRQPSQAATSVSGQSGDRSSDPSAREIMITHHSTKTTATTTTLSKHQGKVQMQSALRSTYKEDAVSISEIRLDTLAVDTSTSSNYGSRGALAWTPPASYVSTPTWTEGTPSYTDSSDSCGDLDSAQSPLNMLKSDLSAPPIEELRQRIRSSSSAGQHKPPPPPPPARSASSLNKAQNKR